MGTHDIFELIAALRAEGAPFCVATVVRTADLTSAKAGAKAVITADGALHGHLGGACVRRAVLSVADDVAATGTARLVSVRPSAEGEAPPPGTELRTSGCPSGGTVDLFVEAYRPPPQLLVVGETPIAEALAAHAELMGLRVARRPLPADATALGPEDAVVIASQGTGDAAALKAALAGDAGHVAMVASHRKAEALTVRLAAEGVAPERLASLEAPAGLDIGAMDPHEIAVSILARLIERRRRG